MISAPLRPLVLLGLVPWLTGCQALDLGIMNHAGPVAEGQWNLYLIVAAVLFFVAAPVLILVPLIAWHYRLSNREDAYRPDWGFSWPIEILTWIPPIGIVIGLGFLLRSLISFFAGHDQRTFDMPLVRAWNFGGLRILPTDVLIAAIAAACLAVVFVLIYRTSFGRQLRAVADSADLARASGIRAGGLMLCLWLLVGALSSIGGVLLGMKAIVMPEMGWESLIPAFAAMVLGGIGSPVGAVLGALVLCVVQELSVPLLGPSYKLVLSFVVLALVLLLRPAGIRGRVQLVR